VSEQTVVHRLARSAAWVGGRELAEPSYRDAKVRSRETREGRKLKKAASSQPE
jgi:hypothetical protein